MVLGSTPAYLSEDRSLYSISMPWSLIHELKGTFAMYGPICNIDGCQVFKFANFVGVVGWSSSNYVDLGPFSHYADVLE